MNQLITVRPNGEVVGLQFKKGFDLRSIGRAQIQRVSEILFSEKEQQWFVKFLYAELHGEIFRYSLVQQVELTLTPFKGAVVGTGGILFFDHYEDAVAAEVTIIQALRAQGNLL